MAIMGRRGTLSNLGLDTPLENKFWGKTGTLIGVRSISGILSKPTGNKIVSIISNNNNNYLDPLIIEILLLIQSSKYC